ncbi:MAG: hypothetical protein FJ284_03210 [Planctomycetes bacterium]|nr:hypothetical protein [Planctomycetota bacterium]
MRFVASRWGVLMMTSAVWLVGSGGRGQEQGFFGGPDEVMTGVISADQDWFLSGTSDRGGVYGWLDGGFVGNVGTPPSKFNGPYNAVDLANEPMMNQVYLVAERTLPVDGSTGIGGRTDLLYGEDFPLATSLGWETNPAPRGWNRGEYYGLAIPQLYAEVGDQDLSPKLRHLYTIVRYEGVPAGGNFFYRKSYSYQFAGPFTQWGGLVEWTAADNMGVDTGLVNGWKGLASPTSGVAFLGRARVKQDDNSRAVSFTIITGDEANDFSPLFQPTPILVSANRTRYSLILESRPAANWEYLFHHWLGTQARGLADGGTALWVGIEQYLFYRVNEAWPWGQRFECFQDTDGTRRA